MKKEDTIKKMREIMIKPKTIRELSRELNKDEKTIRSYLSLMDDIIEDRKQVYGRNVKSFVLEKYINVNMNIVGNSNINLDIGIEIDNELDNELDNDWEMDLDNNFEDNFNNFEDDEDYRWEEDYD